jgi:hypothetical protein
MSELSMWLSERLCKYNKKEEFENLPIDIVQEIAKVKPNNLRPSNRFLGEAENVIFWVFDLPRVITCPGRTTICLEHCYQKDVVKMHKEKGKDSPIEVHHKINFFRSLQNDFVDNMVKEINNKKPNGKDLYIRIHACGDFNDGEYLNKWIEIATEVKKTHPKYYFMAYTKSYKILDNVMKEKIAKDSQYTLDDTNIHFMASIMDHTKKEDMEIIERYHMPKYIATSKDVSSNVLNDCKSIDCAKCLKCYNKPKGEIVTNLR